MPNFDQTAFCNRTNGLNTSIFVFPSDYNQEYDFSKFSEFSAALRVSFHSSKCPRNEGLAIILQHRRHTASHVSQQERKYENLWNGWDWFLELCWVLRAPCWQLRSHLFAARFKTLPKAQRTRGLSSYHKFHTNLDQISILESRLNINFEISTKHQHVD